MSETQKPQPTPVDPYEARFQELIPVLQTKIFEMAANPALEWQDSTFESLDVTDGATPEAIITERSAQLIPGVTAHFQNLHFTDKDSEDFIKSDIEDDYDRLRFVVDGQYEAFIAFDQNGTVDSIYPDSYNGAIFGGLFSEFDRYGRENEVLRADALLAILDIVETQPVDKAAELIKQKLAELTFAEYKVAIAPYDAATDGPAQMHEVDRTEVKTAFSKLTPIDPSDYSSAAYDIVESHDRYGHNNLQLFYNTSIEVREPHDSPDAVKEMAIFFTYTNYEEETLYGVYPQEGLVDHNVIDPNGFNKLPTDTALHGLNGTPLVGSQKDIDLLDAFLSAGNQAQLSINLDRWLGSNTEYDPAQSTEKLTLEGTFNYIRNQGAILGRLQEELLGTNFEKVFELFRYDYVLPLHNGKQVTLRSSNYFSNLGWDLSDIKSGAQLALTVDDRANCTRTEMEFGFTNGEIVPGDGSPAAMAEIMREAIDVIISQDETFPALSAEIRDKLNKIDDQLFHNLALGQPTAEDIAASLAALRYFIGRSQIQPTRTAERFVKNDQNTITILDRSLMIKDGNGSSVPIDRVVTLERPGKSTNLIMSNPNTKKITSFSSPFKSDELMQEIALSRALDFEPDLPVARLDMQSSAQLLFDLEKAINGHKRLGV